MKISIIAAVARHKNGKMVIGKGGALPWRLPEDLRRFKKLTMDCPIIMGRKTYDSIGRPLAGRFNIIISRTVEKIEGCEIARSFDAAIAAAKAQNTGEIFIIGGAQIYQLALSVADKIYLTEINSDAEGDAFFPPFSKTEWREKERAINNGEKFRFDFVVYEKQ